ncbi:MAG: hypothetical protein Q9201_005023 [Fulgogasparrea decipioides]
MENPSPADKLPAVKRQTARASIHGASPRNGIPPKRPATTAEKKPISTPTTAKKATASSASRNTPSGRPTKPPARPAVKTVGNRPQTVDRSKPTNTVSTGRSKKPSSIRASPLTTTDRSRPTNTIPNESSKRSGSVPASASAIAVGSSVSSEDSKRSRSIPTSSWTITAGSGPVQFVPTDVSLSVARGRSRSTNSVLKEAYPLVTATRSRLSSSVPAEGSSSPTRTPFSVSINLLTDANEKLRLDMARENKHFLQTETELRRLIKDRDHEIAMLLRTIQNAKADERWLQDCQKREAKHSLRRVKSLQDSSQQLLEAKERETNEHRQAVEDFERQIQQYEDAKVHASEEHKQVVARLWQELHQVQGSKDRELKFQQEALEALQDEIRDLNEIKEREIEATRQALAEEHEEVVSILRLELKTATTKRSSEDSIRFESQLEQVRATLGSVHASNTELRQALDDTQSELEKARADRDSAHASNTALRQDLDSTNQHFENENSKLRGSLEIANEKNAELASQLRDAHTLIERHSRATHEAQSPLTARTAEVVELGIDRLNGNSCTGNAIRKSGFRGSRWAKTSTNGSEESDGTLVAEDMSSHIQGQVCPSPFLSHLSPTVHSLVKVFVSMPGAVLTNHCVPRWLVCESSLGRWRT